MHGDGIAEQHWSARLMHRLTRHPVTVAAFRKAAETAKSAATEEVGGMVLLAIGLFLVYAAFASGLALAAIARSRQPVRPSGR